MELPWWPTWDWNEFLQEPKNFSRPRCLWSQVQDTPFCQWLLYQTELYSFKTSISTDAEVSISTLERTGEERWILPVVSGVTQWNTFRAAVICAAKNLYRISMVFLMGIWKNQKENAVLWPASEEQKSLQWIKFCSAEYQIKAQTIWLAALSKMSSVIVPWIIYSFVISKNNKVNKRTSAETCVGEHLRNWGEYLLQSEWFFFLWCKLS